MLKIVKNKILNWFFISAISTIFFEIINNIILLMRTAKIWKKRTDPILSTPNIFQIKYGWKLPKKPLPIYDDNQNSLLSFKFWEDDNNKPSWKTSKWWLSPINPNVKNSATIIIKNRKKKLFNSWSFFF